MTAYDIEIPCPRCRKGIRTRVTFTGRPTRDDAGARVIRPQFAAEDHRCKESHE